MSNGTPAPKPESTSHLRTLSNGAVYDMVKKRIVANPGGGTHAITSERASEFAQLRQDQKRQALMRAANAVAAQGGSVDGHQMAGDMAYVEAIGEAMAMKALTVNDPKAVDAARFIFAETGISEKAAQAEAQADDPLRMIGAMALEYIKQRMTIPINVHATNSGETLEK